MATKMRFIKTLLYKRFTLGVKTHINESEKQEKIFHVNGKSKKAGRAILPSEKTLKQKILIDKNIINHKE